MSAIDFSDPATIAFLTDALTAAGVDGLEISRSGEQLRIVIASSGEARIDLADNASAPSTMVVKAPMAGYFCAGHPSRPTASGSLPRPVSGREVLGFIRIGPILLPLGVDRPGILTKRLAEPDALVGFGDPLFEIELPS
jgi:hypothetical protein